MSKRTPKGPATGTPTEPAGPSAKTARGTTVEVLRHAGCGLLHIVYDRPQVKGVVHASAITGSTPEDQRIIDAMIRS